MRRSETRRGAVLVTVLWSIALLSALAMAASVTFRGFAGVMLVERYRVQSDALLTAGLEASAGMIQNLGDAPLRDLEFSLTLSTGSVRAHLSDEGGRIDIGKAPIEVIAALLRFVGALPATADLIARNVIDLRGSRNADRTNGGRRVAGPTNATAEQPFTDVLQLGRIPGMRAEWLGAIAQLATVYGSETVNPLTAPRGVIAALPGVDPAVLETFLAERRQSPADPDRLTRILGPAQRYLAAKPQRVAAIELTASLADGHVAGARTVIVILPQDSEPYRVLVFTPVRSAGLL